MLRLALVVASIAKAGLYSSLGINTKRELEDAPSFANDAQHLAALWKRRWSKTDDPAGQATQKGMTVSLVIRIVLFTLRQSEW